MNSFDENNDKQSLEINEIENKELKESIIDIAMNYCFIWNKDYEQFNNTMCEFGYLFSIKGHGLEGLFKIITDEKTYYFAVQKNKLIGLDFNEELFYMTRDVFLSLH